ncbi:CLUMA_CG012127, isoform A [Clunio marinus]|uniref:Probable ATP-dependent RNA helicase spindle-E n=1 Tax=Clunio marinus TaxID=568069 RepID=A0A1J1IFI2_9DIPT|nr:CLUMA_CG012127, isoform A [Clunio marinus]
MKCSDKESNPQAEENVFDNIMEKRFHAFQEMTGMNKNFHFDTSESSESEESMNGSEYDLKKWSEISARIDLSSESEIDSSCDEIECLNNDKSCMTSSSNFKQICRDTDKCLSANDKVSNTDTNNDKIMHPPTRKRLLENWLKKLTENKKNIKDNKKEETSKVAEIVKPLPEENCCQICNKVSKNRDALRRHMKIHNLKYSCPVLKCQRKFCNKRWLEKHSEKHTDLTRSIVCYKCDMRKVNHHLRNVIIIRVCFNKCLNVLIQNVFITTCEYLIKKYSFDPVEENQGFFNTITSISGSAIESLEESQIPDNVDLSINKELPIYKYREEIIKSLNDHKCIIITGSTGCGKTTQIPKIIVENAVKEKKSFKILISQPRKIAAITNATRVALEMKSRIGNLVGFQFALHRALNNSGEKTKIIYCTTGVILQKLIKGQSMRSYSHIILDEIHERDIEMDLLLILVREYLSTNSPDTKVVLMSATMNANHFANYFEKLDIKTKIVDMEIERNFTIRKKFLDELMLPKVPKVDYSKPLISEEMMKVAADIIFWHVQKDDKSSILVFLPGFYEIEAFEFALMCKFDVKQHYQVIIMHSAVSTDAQRAAFKRDDVPKIILSTNIAENSVTIPKVNVVIDFCLTKYLVVCSESSLTSLQLNWCSKMNCEQRAGRTGRVCDGVVYHLVERSFYLDEMDDYMSPEMKRAPLERVILKTKLLTNQAPLDFLSLALDPPDIPNIQNSILLLKEIGALYRNHADTGEFGFNDGDLTFLGRIIATLPCNIHIGKFIILGYMFSVFHEAVIIGAGLNINGSIFKFDYKKRLDSYSSQLSWSNGSGSDLIAILNAYQLWQKNIKEGNFKSAVREQEWYDKFGLDKKNLFEVKELVWEIKSRLENYRIKQVRSDNFKPIIEEKEKPFLLKICAAGAWLPYFYLLSSNDMTEALIYREIDNLDVHRTIYFKDVERKYSRLYDDVLKQSLIERGICEKFNDMRVNYNENLGRIYVTFLREESLNDRRDDRGIMLVDGKVLPEVYVAVKYKELARNIFTLHVMDHDSMNNYAKQFKYSTNLDCSSMSTASSCVAGLHEVEGKVTHVVHCGKFFFQPIGKKYDNEKRVMEFKIKTAMKCQNVSISDELELTHDDNVVIRLNDDTFHRGIVVKASKDEAIKFNFIDLGNITSDVPLINVYPAPKALKEVFEIPPRCFECKLSEIAPHYMTCPQGVWTTEAITHFRSLIKSDKHAKIEIFSVVNEVVTCTLFNELDVNVNKSLVDNKFAIQITEDYNSRMDNFERTSLISTSTSQIDGEATVVNDISIFTSFENTKKSSSSRLIPPRGMSNMTMNLSGPHSPLETELVSLSAKAQKSIKIDFHSINSVVLNGDINKTSSRLFIASHVVKNRRDGITLREITMLPNLPGLPEILAMIFCPKMALRRSRDKTHFDTLLTGLGCETNGCALFPIRDAILNVNVKFTDNDMANINHLRHCMSMLMYTKPNLDFPDLNEKQKYDLQFKIKNLISDILDASRDVVLKSSHLRPMKHSWVAEDDEEDFIRRTTPLGDRALYPLHSYQKLLPTNNNKEFDNQMELSSGRFIQKTSSGQSYPLKKFCKLCNILVSNDQEIKSHLADPMHQKLQKEFSLKNRARS